MKLTQEQQAELQMVKAHYPYYIIWCMIDKDTGKFSAHATPTMRIPNKMVRKGHTVFKVKWSAADADAAQRIYKIAVEQQGAWEQKIRVEKRVIKMQEIMAKLLMGEYKDILVRNSQGRIQSIKIED